MAQDDHSGTELAAADSSHAALEFAGSTGTAVIPHDGFDNPGFEPHRPRVTDEDTGREKRAQRTVYTLFYISILGSVWAIAAYMLFPIESNDVGAVRLNNMFIGLGATLALLGIGFGAVHWGKSLMTSAESIDIRHPISGSETTQQGAVEVFRQADEESGFSRRTVIRNSLIGALLVFPLPAVVLFRGLAPQDQIPVELLSHTMWAKGTRLALDPSGAPDPGRRRHDRQRLPRHPRRSRRPRARQARGEGQGRGAAHAPRPE